MSWADAFLAAKVGALALRSDIPVADVAYQHDPIGWARDVLGIPEETIRWSLFPAYEAHRWDGTIDPLAAIAEAIARGQDVGVESGTGTGKTFLAGWLCLWFLACFEDAIVVTTAPKEDQLRLHLWKEVGRFFERFRQRYPTAELASLRLRMRAGEDDQEAWALVGYACGVDAETSAKGSQGAASRAKGFHARHMLIVTEETQGIHPSVMTALENTCTGDHNIRLAFGNPAHQLDTLHQFCLSPGVLHVRMSAHDHPNVVTGQQVVPGAVGTKSIARRREKYGLNSVLGSVRTPARQRDDVVHHVAGPPPWVAGQAHEPGARGAAADEPALLVPWAFHGPAGGRSNSAGLGGGNAGLTAGDALLTCPLCCHRRRERHQENGDGEADRPIQHCRHTLVRRCRSALGRYSYHRRPALRCRRDSSPSQTSQSRRGRSR